MKSSVGPYLRQAAELRGISHERHSSPFNAVLRRFREPWTRQMTSAVRSPQLLHLRASSHRLDKLG